MCRFFKLQCFLFLIFLYGESPASTSAPSPTSNQALGDSLAPKAHWIYDVDFGFLFDNLEDSDPYWATRTLLSAKLSPEVGLAFDNQTIKLGGYFILDMGEQVPQNGGMTLYYSFDSADFSAYLGAFPKKYQIGKYPLLYWREDYDFYHSNFNGTMFQYHSADNGTDVELILNWYGGKLIKRIDEFMLEGFWQSNFYDRLLFIGASSLVFHIKNDEILNPTIYESAYLLDRIYYEARIGSDLSSLAPSFDQLSLQLSLLASLERKRFLDKGIEPFDHRIGGELGFQIQYQGFGFGNSLYVGDSHMKFFSQYGDDLKNAGYSGLPFYQSSLYNRSELYYQYQNSYLNLKCSVIFHTTQKHFAHQQMITLSLDTEKLLRQLF
ncbi:hypothetical protein BBW65_01405 [Helicobacter enhydrae]|uniref:Uncharacterized protein n=2 Tax=Helicobacter enhydrae TaxID=222136 RepID=A0A1B1U467_9HELI|nr:hypothetical protein BBW65_01405 [Helicobacter enhydrae]